MGSLKKVVVLLSILTLMVVAVFVFVGAIDAKTPSGISVASTKTEQVITWEKNGGDLIEVWCAEGEKRFNPEYKLIDTLQKGTTELKREDLQAGFLYNYKLISVNTSFGQERKSEPAEFSAYTSPYVAENFHAATKSERSLTAFWNDTQVVTGFTVEWSDNKQMENSKSETFAYDKAAYNGDGTLGFTVYELEEGKTYYLKMNCYMEIDGVRSTSEFTEVISAKVTKAVDMTGVDINAPMVALTYDDGPDYENVTNRIIKAVEGAGGKATFFQLGHRAEENAETMKRLVAGGHEIGNHTFDHSNYGSSVTHNDIISGADAIEKACGVRPTAFRSPGGMTTDGIRSACEEEGVGIYFWSVDTCDWETRDADSIVSNIQNYTTDGSIILMHNIYDSTAEATERIVPWLQSQGYQLVTVSQLVQAKTGEPPVPGLQYYTATRTD